MPCQHECKPGHTRCAACQANYMRDYRRLRRGRAIKEAARHGAESLREAAAEFFEDMGDIELNGRMAARYIRELAD